MADPVDAATGATLRWWRQPDRYGALLLLLVLDYLAALLVGSHTTGQPVLLLLTILSLLLALHTSQVRGRVLAFALGACGVAVLIAIVEAARNEARASAVVSMVVGLLLLSTPVSILRRILGFHRIISSETLAAALCTYLLVGLAFANIYTAIDAWTPGSFDNVDASDRLSDLVYFSFVTLTTVGYGDIVPTTDLARSLAVTEALMGQIVLVTFVGRIVGQMAAPSRPTPLANMHEAFEEEVGQAEAAPDEGPEADPDAGPR
jgi:hypothetical protein